MARRRFSSWARSVPVLGALGLTLALTGCGDGANGGNEGGGDSGATTSGGQNAASGHENGGQGGARSMAGQGGAPVSTAGASSGAAGSGGVPRGGAPTAGSGGAAGETGGAGGVSGANGGAGASGGGAGGAPSGECTRALLDGLLDDYFAALSAGDPTTLPLAADVKFTENAEATGIGTTDFWKNAGDIKYSQRALDTQACSAAAQAVVPEGTTDRPLAVRIKVEGGKLTEIETIVVRPGDYSASFAVDSNPAAIIAIAADIGWDDEVPAAQRATRQQLTSWIDKYFRAFPSGVCNVTSACRRLENGGGNFSCGTGASCSNSTPTSGGTFEPRVTVVDELRGIAAGFTIFDYQTTGHLDMHMIKMSAGQVHAVHAILRNTDGKSGWD
jgi:hypothetical protein